MIEQPYISATNLCKIYPNSDNFAVKDLCLDINKGEIFGLLGPNGAGKTTTLSMLCSLLSPTSGKIIIDNHNIATEVNKIRKIIGVVPQDITLYPKLTARENLRFFGNMYGLKGKELREKIDFFLEEFGLISKRDNRVETFSGGMKRRINLLAGTLHNPDILFLDEPTVGIDVQSRLVIMDFLKKLNANNTTIVYTSHHMEEAQGLCTKIGIIDSGNIIASGSPADLIANYDDCETLEDIFIKHTGRQLRD